MRVNQSHNSRRTHICHNSSYWHSHYFHCPNRSAGPRSQAHGLPSMSDVKTSTLLSSHWKKCGPCGKKRSISAINLVNASGSGRSLLMKRSIQTVGFSHPCELIRGLAICKWALIRFITVGVLIFAVTHLTDIRTTSIVRVDRLVHGWWWCLMRWPYDPLGYWMVKFVSINYAFQLVFRLGFR